MIQISRTCINLASNDTVYARGYNTIGNRVISASYSNTARLYRLELGIQLFCLC